MVYLGNHRSPASLNFDFALRLLYIVECHYTLLYIGRWLLLYTAIGLHFAAFVRNVAFRIVGCCTWLEQNSPWSRRGTAVLRIVGTPA